MVASWQRKLGQKKPTHANLADFSHERLQMLDSLDLLSLLEATFSSAPVSSSFWEAGMVRSRVMSLHLLFFSRCPSSTTTYLRTRAVPQVGDSSRYIS